MILKILLVILLVILIISISLIYIAEFEYSPKNSIYKLINSTDISSLSNCLQIQIVKLLTELKQSPINANELYNQSKLFILFSNVKQKKIIGIAKIGMANQMPRLSKIINDKDLVYISSVIINKRYRNKKFGIKMFNILIRLITNSAILEVNKKNIPAIKLYHHMGFKIINETTYNYLMILSR